MLHKQLQSQRVSIWSKHPFSNQDYGLEGLMVEFPNPEIIEALVMPLADMYLCEYAAHNICNARE